MNTIDIVLALILLYGLVRGFFRGLLAEVASLVGIVVGIYGAIHFSYLLADFFSENMGWDTQYVNLIAFAITFVLIVFFISLAGRVLTKIAAFAALGLVNKFLGGAFGLIKVAFLASVVIMFFKATNEEIDIISEESLERSVLYEPIESIAPMLLPSILREAEKRDILEDFDEITKKTEARN
ncbi:MAG: CvpA family protein [Salegentibacter sp.]|uniref:Membrane protein required for colicin V production n=1 Tax=Salegentibacter flavus TaxID=287099 RepID=A0A1I5AXJ8_9FLAO|nr:MULTISPECIES: CvpA family protein [Salegentibacter]MDR9455876.1 CvpA family protein [Salegentibacter sp.]SFN66959.1 membrane protein required for colicin V production [Salegentibacter flavus]